MVDEIQSTEGRILGSQYTVTFTPEVLLWLNSDVGKKTHRKIFFKKLQNLLDDISRFGRPKRGRAKIIPTVEAPVYTIRLENNQGIRVLFDYETHKGIIDLSILAVSEKKNFQDKLRRSAEHIVHASSFDRLDWQNEDEMIDLRACSDADFETLRKNASLRFGSLPVKEQSEGWSKKDYQNRKRRATIYDFVIPNVVDYSILKESSDFELPPILKLQEHQKQLLNYTNDQFLLEGVAGTGKTTILLYRFVNDIKNLKNTVENSLNKILFVTHNDRLKRDIISSLRLFFPPDEYVVVSKRVKTTRELFFELLGDPNNVNNKLTKENKNFPKENELTRDRFRSMFDKNDIDVDLFWEEYRGILRGYNLKGDSSIISKREYNEIGRRRGRIRTDQRDDFYYLARQKLARSKEGNSSFDFNKNWDSLSLCRAVLDSISSNNILQNIQCMYVDEVQDLAKSEMEILLMLLDPLGIKRFAVAGDLSQSIQPSSFTWQALSELIYEVLNVKVNKHETLLENFRSTPYLVQAANRILELQDELDHDATPELQRPFAGENTGEPGHIFFEEEEKMFEELIERNLPNAACPILVRDIETRNRLRKKLGNNANVITIAQFKGLERRNILLWEPDSGSERVLNLRYNPVRGEFAKRREFSDSTALLELRHVFVAFTRARYMMGILAPQNKESHFLNHLLSLNESGLQDSELEKLQLFEEILSNEALLEYAREYEEAGMFEQAAEAYRNINDEHKYEHCKGKAAIEEQAYDEAIHHLYQAAKVEIGIESDKAGRLISEISTIALDSTELKKRAGTLAKILMGAVGLSRIARHRLKAEQDEERENWSSAAKNYIQAGDYKRAESCIRRITEFNLQTTLFLECERNDMAKDSFKKYAERSIKRELAVRIALGEKDVIKTIFVGALEALSKEFSKADVGWARSLAVGDSSLMNYVKEKGQIAILERVNSNSNQEKEVLKILIKTNDLKELKKRNKRKEWRFIPQEAIVQEHIMEKNYARAINSVFDIDSELVKEKFLKSIGKEVNRRNERIGIFKILSSSKATVKIKLAPSNQFFASIIAIGIIAESTKIDSKEFQNLRTRMYSLIGNHNQLDLFCLHWSAILMNFQIRNGSKEVSASEKYELEVLIAQHEKNKQLNLELVGFYAAFPKLRSPDNDRNVRVLWNKLSAEEKQDMHINLAMSLQDKVDLMPKFMEITRETELILEAFRRRNPQVSTQMKREGKKIFKTLNKEFKNYELTFVNPPAKNIKSLFKNSLREIFSSSQIMYLRSGQHKQAFEEVDFELLSPTGLTNEVEIEKASNQETKEHSQPLDENLQSQVSAENTSQLNEELVQENLLVDFEEFTDSSGSTTFGSEAWEQLINSDPKHHVDVVMEIVQSKNHKNLIEERMHLLECVDECLLTDRSDVKSFHKFAVLLAIQRTAEQIEKNTELVNVLPESTQESIRLFKEQNKREVLDSRMPYSMRVLN
jgi:hypothetical protein